MRLTGMDVKMEQYRRASASSRRSPRPAERSRCNRLWAGPRRCRSTARSTIRRPGSPDGRRRERVTDESAGRRDPAPGRTAPSTAIALSPILSARYRARDLERIRAAAPGAGS